MKFIPLTQGQFAKVDDHDFDWLNQWKWYAQKHGKTFYAVRRLPREGGKQPKVWMHCEILPLPEGLEVEHRDRDGLNNQRHNLRPATRSQNNCNRGKVPGTSSRFKGVYWRPLEGKWAAAIGHEGKKFFLGRFNTEEAAAEVYDAKARELFGEFANPNSN